MVTQRIAWIFEAPLSESRYRPAPAYVLAGKHCFAHKAMTQGLGPTYITSHLISPTVAISTLVLLERETGMYKHACVFNLVSHYVNLQTVKTERERERERERDLWRC